MRPTQATQKFTPLIKFLGKRSTPKNVDHTPKVHPLSGMKSLPASFGASSGGSSSGGSSSGSAVIDSILDLPSKFQTPKISESELEQVNSGAAEVIY